MVELREFFRVVRYRAVVIALLTAVGVGTAALWLARSPDEYVATTRLFVSGASAASQYEAQQGGVYAQDRVVSYEQLVASRTLAQKTIDALNLNMDAEALAADITPTSYPDAAVMDISATADSPRQARDIANELAKQFIWLASGLETPPDSATPVVRLTVIDAAQDGTPSRLLPAKLIYIFGGLLGFFVGLIVAFVLESYARRIRNGVDVDRAIGERPVADLPATSADLKPISEPEMDEAIGRLRVNIATADGSIPRTFAIAGVGGGQLARRFAAEAGLNLVNALLAEDRKALLLVLDSSPDIEARVGRFARSSRKATGRQVRIQWGFGDRPQYKPLLDRDSILEELGQLKKTHEIVVVVLPPLNQFAHAAAVAPTMDGVVGLGIYHRTSCSELEGHLAEIQRTGATSLGVAFAHRTLARQPSRPGRPIEAPETPEADDVAAGTDAPTEQSAATQASPDSPSESTETVRSAQAVSLNHR
jgi:capsular polysaccharide biosynthesis protein